MNEGDDCIADSSYNLKQYNTVSTRLEFSTRASTDVLPRVTGEWQYNTNELLPVFLLILCVVET